LFFGWIQGQKNRTSRPVFYNIENSPTGEVIITGVSQMILFNFYLNMPAGGAEGVWSLSNSVRYKLFPSRARGVVPGGKNPLSTITVVPCCNYPCPQRYYYENIQKMTFLVASPATKGEARKTVYAFSSYGQDP
jgi:hypothetical protein